MTIYNFFHFGIVAITVILLGYQLTLVLSAFFFRPGKQLTSDYNRTFLIVIPCVGENPLISKTLYSLSGSVYPMNLYKLVIIVDRSSSQIEEIARGMGVQVIEWPKNRHGKCIYSFYPSFENISDWDVKYDAVVIISPDSLISAGLLEVMNSYLEQGYNVVQSSHLAASKPVGIRRTWQVSLLFFNYINSLGRKRLGFDVKLTGNGMCFSINLIKKYFVEMGKPIEKWDEITLVSSDSPIAFAPEARVWSSTQGSGGMPKSSGIRYRQNRNYQKVKKWLRSTWTSLRHDKSLRSLDNFMKLIIPPMPLILVISTAMMALDSTAIILGMVPVSFIYSWLVIILMVSIYLLLVFLKTRNTYLDPKYDMVRKASVMI